jgi:hypothetical protein
MPDSREYFGLKTLRSILSKKAFHYGPPQPSSIVYIRFFKTIIAYLKVKYSSVVTHQKLIKAFL